MKKSIAYLFLTVLYLVTWSQINAQNYIELTPKVGYSSTLISKIPVLNTKNSFRFGITGDYYFNEKWSFKSGLIYFPMGQEFESTNSNGQTSQLVDKLNYLNIPLNGNFHFGSTKNWNLNFGLTTGFLINGEISGIEESELNKFQIGLSYGLGYKFSISENFALLADIQGFRGISKIIKGDGKSVNIGWSLNLGGAFRLN